MRELLRRLFRGSVLNKAGRAEERARSEIREQLEQLNWMLPPGTVTDPAAWDRYWQDQLSHGFDGFVHLFVDDGELVDAMRAHELRTVLCVGNGISQEPRALAWAGFDVTSLDISPVAAKVASDAAPPEDFLARLVGGRSGGQKGRLDFVVGDLCDPALCPGPYDVVIDRKTLQLWPEGERPAALQAVANRLASRGIFFSQSHDGRWKPPAPRRHALEPWFVAERWALWRPEAPLTGRVAWLLTTTG
jgi:SAM-dependent methyltransferase